jgi:hypothetical protein
VTKRGLGKILDATLIIIDGSIQTDVSFTEIFLNTKLTGYALRNSQSRTTTSRARTTFGSITLKEKKKFNEET